VVEDDVRHSPWCWSGGGELVVVDNVRRVVGGRRSTYFWIANWVGGVPLQVQFPRLFDLTENK